MNMDHNMIYIIPNHYCLFFGDNNVTHTRIKSNCLLMKFLFTKFSYCTCPKKFLKLVCYILKMLNFLSSESGCVVTVVTDYRMDCVARLRSSTGVATRLCSS